MNQHTIVYNLNPLVLPPKKKKPWYKSGFLGFAIIFSIMIGLGVLFGDVKPEEVVKKRPQTETAIISSEEYSIPVLGSPNIQDRIRITASPSTKYSEPVLRVFMHLYDQAQTGKERYERKFGAFHSRLLAKIDSSYGTITGSLIEQLHEVPRNGQGLIYASDLCFMDPMFEFWHESSSLFNQTIRVTDYHRERRKAVAVIAARNESDFEKGKIVVYLRGVNETLWSMWDDAQGVARKGIKDAAVKDLKALAIIFYNPLSKAKANGECNIS